MNCYLLSLCFLATVLELVSSSSDLSGGLGDLAKILAELSGGNQCAFKCPRGKENTEF